ncbi:hypothetical protein Nans01_01440 [Nocardiopsis ansamitocini]|uniref:Uncharacterized protein n=1 Tax=Nocardiopsis ansamitocini TaxID=1670832 RepID=A0A9W6P271_9ACTN|nr:hypothetical protein Nans01_01440 [Nocardiopsis ansamitocini]
MVVAAIVICEALFWVLVLGGLATRYLLRMRVLSAALFLLVPVLDVLLLSVITVHLAKGATAEWSHGVGVLYLGFTVAYGHSVIAWADVRFAHRFAGGPAPTKAPRKGAARVRHEAVAWARGSVAAAIGAGVLWAMIWFVGDPERVQALSGFYAPLSIFMLVNTIIAGWGIAKGVLSLGDGTAAEETERVRT